MAQTARDDVLPPPSPPSVENYSLPPGPGSVPNENRVQGPVDPDVPIVRPTIVAPRPAPVKPLPDPGVSTKTPVAVDSSDRPSQSPARPAPSRVQPDTEIVAPEAEPEIANPAVSTDQPLNPAEAPGLQNDAGTASVDPDSETVPAKASNDWYILLVAGLFFALLGAMLLWRKRHQPPEQTQATEIDGGTVGAAARVAAIPEPPKPAPTIALDFQPQAASATLFNAVLGFEIALSNHGEERLTEILIQGIMDQSGEKGAPDSALSISSPIADIPAIQSGETRKIVAEFRIPLTSIRPIRYRSQALFVPFVQISIEFTDQAGFKHFQSASYLVGLEHQPPQAKMAPFRLDLGPRSFAPLGCRPVTGG